MHKGLTSRSLQWTYNGITCQLDNVSYGNDAQGGDFVYPRVICIVSLKREPKFYLVNVVLPCMLLLFIGSLAFCLAPGSGEKVSLSVTVFLALTVFLMAVMAKIPSSADEVPLLGRFH